MVIDKTLASASNLSKLLPTGTVLAFQTLSPSFTNKGHCYASNRILTYALIVICVASCLFFTFTDSLTGRDGQLYYGVATSKGLYILNEDQLRRLRRRWVDWVHALFGVAVFLALAFGDGNVQSCFFPSAGRQSKELLVNLPLGAAVFASLVFMVFPTSRKGIGYTDGETENR
ncbi:hypothetical protein AXF42_Ash020184 [Apostasia shenzhenica]|uniref:Uncharacterized protein n=1 Tax=Apostasia shenzhenica TaxID=1088818 RepID=A0A2H9ZVW5_9ASPA|nr:hypothetical protein AXF42_Ash020184 [Apostasia shenzhenica]